MPQHVLIVDDDLPTLRLVERILSMAGYAVRTARDGEDARMVIEGERPSLVITDLLMPRMSGHELIAHLREEDPALPIIAFSAARPSLDLSGVPILAKPFAHAELLALVQELLPVEPTQDPG